MPLDNAGLIFPAALRRHWSNAYRISFTFREPVDPHILQQALEAAAPRFPSVCVRLRRSAFWYYLEELDRPPAVRPDGPQPLVGMTRADVRRCSIRVLYYGSRMAVEFFHAVTDGTGAMIFAKTLAAEYLRRRTGAAIPCGEGVLDLAEPPRSEELADCFQEHAGAVSAPRDSLNVYRPGGTPEPDRFLHLTLGILDGELLHRRAKERGVTVTAYLTAVLLASLLDLQAEDVPRRRRRRPVKVQIPVNLRQLYGGGTLRNFVAVANVGVDPRMGDYTFDELVGIVHHQMALAITPKNMQAIFTPNVNDARNPFLKPVPLFLKNLIMRAVFDAVGEQVSCMSLSNLGNVRLPAAMAPLVERVEFVLGPQSTAPYNLGVTGWDGQTFLNLVRNTREPRLERLFFTRLVELGFHVKLESNDK
jgi:hypothetical protein